MDVHKRIMKFSGKGAGYILLTLAAALALWLFVAANYHRTAVEDISRSLAVINDYKTAQLSAWLDANEREAVSLSRHPFFGEIVSQEMASPGSRRAQLNPWLSDYIAQKRYAGMAFLSPKGAVIAATPGYVPETAKPFTEAFALASKNGKALLTDLYLNADGTPRMAMLSPISAGGRGGKTVCVIVIKIDPETELYPLLDAAPLFFTKAETLLVRKEGGYALFLNNLDYRKDAALKFKLPLSDMNLPAAAALKGGKGFFAGLDYRGVKVFSAMGPVPGTNWAILTKVDRETILGPVKTSEYRALALILSGAGLLYFIVQIILRTRQLAGEELLLKGRQLLAETEQVGKVGGWEFNIDTMKQVWTEEVYRIHELDTAFRPDVEKGINFYTPESRTIVERAIQHTLKTGEGFDLNLEIITAKGNTRAVHTIGKVDLAHHRVYGFFQDITDRKRAEQELRESRGNLEAALSSMTDAVFISDNAGRFIEFNDAFATFHKFRNKTECAKQLSEYPDFLEVFLPDGKLAPLEMWAVPRALRGEIVTNAEYKLRRKDTGETWAGSYSFAPIRDDKGVIVGSVVVGRDITVRKKAEEMLRESEQRYRLLLNSIPDTSVLLFDHDHRFLVAGGTEIARSGFDKKLVEGRKLSEAFPPDVAELFKPLYDKALKGEASAFEHWYGSLYYYQQVLPVFDTKGAVSAGMVVSTNLTVRKRAEEALKKSEQRLRSLWTHMTEGVALHELVNDAAGQPADYRIIETNPQYERILNIQAADVTGKLATEAYGTPAAPYLAEYAAVVRSGLPRQIETYFAPLNKYFSISIAPWGAYGFATIFTDVTARRLVELEREKLNRNLIEKKQEMENFLYITTHDLRGPLVNIQGFSQNLQHYVRELQEALIPAPLPPETRQGLEKLTMDRMPGALKFVVESSRKMDALITALLKVSRMGRVEMRPATVDMNELLRIILASLSYQLQQAGGKINCAILPPCKADPGAVSQLFTNLLDNAIKYRDESRALEVTVTGEVKEGAAFYTVADNGSGIPAGDLDRIWNVFYQPERAHKNKGEGIGLPTVKRIAEKNGGSIKAQSKEGEGSTFYVELPAAGEGEK